MGREVVMNKQSKLASLVTDLDILGQNIEVSYLEEVLMDGEECYGLARFDTQEILIQDIPTMTYESKLKHLTHEIFEHINDKMEMDLTHPQITQLEMAVFYVLRHNPNLCKAFTLYRGKKES